VSAVIDYRRKLYAIRDLPTLPAIAQRVLTLADDDDAGPEKLSAIITSDQSLSIKVLTMANSAYYGHRGKIGTIRQALVVIGMNMLKQVALSALVFGTVGRGGRNRASFWKHSFGAAMASSMIAKRTRLADPDLCFMAGLLHDVGKLIIDAYFPNDPEMNHTEVGAWMAERWQLPQQLIDAMAWHHSIEPEHLSQPIVACVNAANVCSKLALAGTEKEEDVAPEVLKALGLTTADFLGIVADLTNRKSQIDGFLV
jgi:putative nucleotidyltransferase with HDIG domain